MYQRKMWTTGFLVLGLVAAVPGNTLVAQEEQPTADEWVQPSFPETFSAYAIVMGNVATGRNTGMQI